MTSLIECNDSATDCQTDNNAIIALISSKTSSNKNSHKNQMPIMPDSTSSKSRLSPIKLHHKDVSIPLLYQTNYSVISTGMSQSQNDGDGFIPHRYLTGSSFVIEPQRSKIASFSNLDSVDMIGSTTSISKLSDPTDNENIKYASGASTSQEYLVHNRISGWKLTSPKRREELLGILENINRPGSEIKGNRIIQTDGGYGPSYDDDDDAGGDSARMKLRNQRIERQTVAWENSVRRLVKARYSGIKKLMDPGLAAKERHQKALQNTGKKNGRYGLTLDLLCEADRSDILRVAYSTQNLFCNGRSQAPEILENGNRSGSGGNIGPQNRDSIVGSPEGVKYDKNNSWGDDNKNNNSSSKTLSNEESYPKVVKVPEDSLEANLDEDNFYDLDAMDEYISATNRASSVTYGQVESSESTNLEKVVRTSTPPAAATTSSVTQADVAEPFLLKILAIKTKKTS